MDYLPNRLPVDVVKRIKDFISDIDVKERPLKEGVLNIVREYAKVVMYPLPEKENNDAFLIKDIPWSGGKYSFVFINTNKTQEKQVFAAAHELGHILNVASIFEGESGIDEENVVNRFAAELLMPEDDFRARNEKDLQKINANGTFLVSNFLDVVVREMNHYFTTTEAVILRFWELEIIDDRIAKLLLVSPLREKAKEYIEAKINNTREYSALQNITKKRSFDGLDEVLGKIKKQNVDKNDVPQANRLMDKYKPLVEGIEKDLNKTFKEDL